jgi:hypothetical protein
MKMKNVLLFASCAVLGITNAQEDQTAKANKMGEGKFMSYVITESSGNYTYGGINREVWTFSFKPFEGDFKEIVVQEADQKTNSYYPDEEAFPMTYVWGSLNTESCMRGWNYIERRSENRLVILDEWVYILEKWENKDNYRIQKCFKKGEMSGFSLTKKAFGAAKEMEKANHKETLQKYLDEAYKKQMELLPAWKEKNQAKLDQRQAAKVRYRFTIDSVNGKYWSSDEGKRVKARLDQKAGQAKVTLVNDLGFDLLLCHGQGVSTRLKPGEKREFSCEESSAVKKGKPRANNTLQFDATDVVLLSLDGKNCGRVVKASTVYK